jgi:predicted RNA-binding protein associated with RNAse of E/G family
MKPGDPVHIEYIRPGKEITYYDEDFVAQDESCLRTFKQLPPEIVARLTRALQRDNLIGPEAEVHSIRKVYFFDQAFNLLEFRDQNNALLGHYSDIGEPVIKLGENKFQMTDLYLDHWLYPEGRLLELDWDEFEEAIKLQIITPAQAELARATLARLVSEVKQGIYPAKYL